MENNKRLDLIDRTKVWEELKQIDWNYLSLRSGGDLTDGIEQVYELIESAPTVDTVEVVHAKWEKDPEMRRMNGHIYDYRCSNCHSPAEKGCYNNNDKLTNYCPNCGAKMDGDVQ